MNQRIKKLWIKALRSGKYKQGKGALHPTESTFCCLGVLCDVYRKQEGGDWDTEKDDGFAFLVDHDSEEYCLPEVVMFWAELDRDDPKLSKRTNARSAATLNDANETFEYIATRIEKYL